MTNHTAEGQDDTIEVARIVIKLYVDGDGHQVVDLGVDTEAVPYVTAHGMLSLATELLPLEYDQYGVVFDDDYEEEDDA